MAKIYSFLPRPAAVRPDRELVGTAQIVIFPGVRYERSGDVGPGSATGARNGGNLRPAVAKEYLPRLD
jgi:hypothetical protein